MCGFNLVPSSFFFFFLFFVPLLCCFVVPWRCCSVLALLGAWPLGVLTEREGGAKVEFPEFWRIEMTDAPMQRLHQRPRVMPFTKRSVYEWVPPPVAAT